MEITNEIIDHLSNLSKLKFEDEIKRVKEVKNFSKMFAILIEIENKKYSIARVIFM